MKELKKSLPRRPQGALIRQKEVIKILLIISSLGLSSCIGLKNFSLGSEHPLTANTKVNKEEKILIPKAKLSLGTNLAGLFYWSTEFPFKDLFRMSSNWSTQGEGKWDTNEANKLDLDANGWVKSLHPEKKDHKYNSVVALIQLNAEKDYFRGEWIVLYEGEGEIEYGFAAQKNVALSKPGRDVISISIDSNNSGFYLKIKKTNPKNYIRNIRIIRAKDEKNYQTDIFNPDFIKRIKPFGTLRFMDWMQTNNSTQKNWQDRPTLKSATWHNFGAPVEVMVDLANKTNSNPWFTMPHQATDDYIKHFAQYVKAHLHPNLKVYVEYSNEVWNYGFQQANYAKQKGVVAFANLKADEHTKQMYWYSKRTTEVVGIWNQVFQNQKERIIGVMGAQSGNTWTAEQALKYAWSNSTKTSKDYGIKAIAIAPYFGNYLGASTAASQVQTWTTDQLFKEITVGGVLKNGPKGGALQDAYHQISNYVQLAKKYNLQLVAYEGGQHLVGYSGIENNQTITDLFIKFNQDPRLKGIYKQYITKWGQLGGGLFMNFTDINPSTKWGSWGVLETISQTSSPKYDALKELSQK